MTFELSQHSLDKLYRVHPDLVAVVKRAITLTTQDFAVVQGLRSEADEAIAVSTGHSKTMHSRHLTGHAVDLAPVVNGARMWDWPYFYPIVLAMQAAGKQLAVSMNWGADWDMELQQFTDPEQARADYIAREKAKGVDRPLLDGPHFQLTWQDYPAA